MEQSTCPGNAAQQESTWSLDMSNTITFSGCCTPLRIMPPGELKQSCYNRARVASKQGTRASLLNVPMIALAMLPAPMKAILSQMFRGSAGVAKNLFPNVPAHTAAPKREAAEGLRTWQACRPIIDALRRVRSWSEAKHAAACSQTCTSPIRPPVTHSREARVQGRERSDCAESQGLSTAPAAGASADPNHLIIPRAPLRRAGQWEALGALRVASELTAKKFLLGISFFKQIHH